MSLPSFTKFCLEELYNPDRSPWKCSHLILNRIKIMNNVPFILLMQDAHFEQYLLTTHANTKLNYAWNSNDSVRQRAVVSRSQVLTALLLCTSRVSHFSSDSKVRDEEQQQKISSGKKNYKQIVWVANVMIINFSRK